MKPAMFLVRTLKDCRDLEAFVSELLTTGNFTKSLMVTVEELGDRDPKKSASYSDRICHFPQNFPTGKNEPRESN